ncbi:MAG: hypothetical protein J5623_06080 [Clostridiales bacterium]|nr:hypothetical protein [Clostridiales bacterium]
MMTITKINIAIPIPIGSAYSEISGIFLIHPFFDVAINLKDICHENQYKSVLITYQTGYMPFESRFGSNAQIVAFEGDLVIG